MTSSLIPYDTHSEVVINRAKFDVCMSKSFGGVKAYILTARIALYMLDCFIVILLIHQKLEWDLNWNRSYGQLYFPMSH